MVRLLKLLKTMWQRFEAWAIPLEVREGDLLERRRAEMTVKAAMIGASADFVWAPFEATLVSVGTAVLCVVIGLILALTPALMRWTGSPRLAAHYLVTLISLGVFAGAWFAGGDTCLNLVSLILGPVLVALLIRGWRSTTAWTILYGVGVGAFHAAHQRGLMPASVNSSIEDMVYVMGQFIIFMVAGSAVIALLFDGTRNEALVEAHRRGEALAKALEKVEAASLAKSEFLATMSHELRTPMNGVLGMAELTLRGDIGGEEREYVGIIQSSAQELLEHIEAILDYAGIEAGRIQLEQEPFTVHKLVANALGAIEAVAGDRKLGLTTSYEGDVEVELIGDPGKLRRALLNVLNNAVKFTEAGGISVLGSCEREGRHYALRLVVQDTGVGIAEEYHERIFERFTQVDGSYRRRFGGVGLGLAVARELIRTMGGEVTVTSAPDEGSRFEIALLLDSAPPRLVRALAPALESTGCRRVLLAEDNPVNRVVAVRMLEEIGCEVVTAINGRLAVEQLKAREYDIVLMDCQMPEMDGLEATRAIRALPGARRAVPIVALTANARVEDRVACMEAGMDGFVTKPVTLSELTEALETRRLGAA